MFEQSQLERFEGGTRKPVSVIAGFVLQGALLSGALVFSLLVTEVAPRLRFNSSLMTPPRARRNSIAIEQPTHPRRPVRVRFVSASALTTPPSIPRETVILKEAQKPEVEPINAFVGVEVADGVTGGTDRNDFWLPNTGSTETEPPAPPPTTVQNHHPPEPMRIGGDVAAARLIHKVQPIDLTP